MNIRLSNIQEEGQIQSGKLKKTFNINSLLWNMITVSDNECYNELVKRQGVAVL